MRNNLLKNLRLGIITGTPAFRDESGQVWVNHSIGRLCEAIKGHFPKTHICLPILPTLQPNHNHILQFDKDAIVDLPPLHTTIQAQCYFWQTRQVIQRFTESADLLFVRLPIQIPWAVAKLPKPKLLHVVSNPRKVIDSSSDYCGVKKWLAQRFADYSERSIRRMATESHTRVCSNGDEMWQRLGCRHGRIVVSSCLLRDEIKPRTDFRLHDPPRLLFVGYLRPEKGIHVLLDAFEKLRHERPLRLTLVGGSDRITGAEAAARNRVTNSCYQKDIQFLGMMPYDDSLFQIYRDHDLYLQPSLSEGTPRALVEARAFGCPAIASRVGGIPTSIHDGINGLLVEAGNADRLVNAIRRLLDDDSLRFSIIQEGLRERDQLTLEHFANELVEELQMVAGSTGLSPPSSPTPSTLAQ